MKDEENMEPDYKSKINWDTNKEEAVKNRFKELATLDRERNSLTPEQVVCRAAKLKAERRKRRLKGAGIAVAAVLFIAIGVTLEIHYNPDSLVVMALRDVGIISENDGNVIIKDNNVDVDENDGERVEVHTSWDEVIKAKEDYPEMLIPEYVPEGYEFEKLEICTVGGRLRTDYLFFNGYQTITITITPNSGQTVLYDYSKIIEGSNGQNIYINN
ncbi:MAG TPA: hypothetical protein VJY37_05135, partial [Anaerovoracaceae bacterium]|nr:hypothetical protein [Anaerovoracaceae bacterium]